MSGFPQCAWWGLRAAPRLLRMRIHCSLEAKMTERTPTTDFMLDLPEPIDIIAVERRARELRAQAFNDALRALVGAVLRRGATVAPSGRGQTA
jgi:hypothetical protein